MCRRWRAYRKILGWIINKEKPKKERNMQFGERLKELREQKGVSLRTAGKATAMSGQYLWSLECSANRRIPSPEKLRNLSKYYSVPIKDLLADAGYVQDSALEADDEDYAREMKVTRAFIHIINDPRFPSGKDIIAKTAQYEVKMFIIELYQRITGQKLL